MIPSDRIPAALRKALGFIESSLEADGGLASFSSPHIQPFTSASTYYTTFVPALVLNALVGIPGTGAERVRAKLSTFIAAQRSVSWSFNYWAVQVNERRMRPYPDDLDDTFCALLGLYRYNPRLIDAAALAQIVQLLVTTETKPGGPYRTWLVSGQSNEVWLDIDVAVNANIAYFLTLIGSPLPTLNSFLEQAIKDDELTSPYYPSVYPVIYYIARAYHGPAAHMLQALLTDLQQDGYWETPLQTALAVSAMHTLGPSAQLEKAQDYLLAQQNDDGSWPAEAFCIDPNQQGQQYYHGSAVLTTALVLEALQGYEPIKHLATKTQTDQRAKQLHAAVASSVQQQYQTLQSDIAQQAQIYVDALLQHDVQQEIVLLPYYFWQSLARPPALADATLVDLGAANVYGWIAYTIYDDFLDDEGKPQLLSIANVALRNSLVCFEAAVPDARFQDFVQHTFDTIDKANMWEVRHCRFEVTDKTIEVGDMPDYGQGKNLADRSLGHTLTPTAVALLAGIPLESHTMRALQAALRHYLIARQMSDDMHDWERDLQAGHVSYVVATIMRSMRLKQGAHRFAELLPSMQKRFWSQLLPGMCDEVLQHIAAARRSVPHELPRPNMLDVFFDRVEATIVDTRRQQGEARRFLDSYHA